MQHVLNASFPVLKILKEEVEELIEAAEIFNSKILDFIEKLNSEKIAEFRIKMETLLKQV